MQDWGKALFVSSLTAGTDPNIGLERSIVVYKRIDLLIYQLVNIHLTNLTANMLDGRSFEEKTKSHETKCDSWQVGLKSP